MWFLTTSLTTIRFYWAASSVCPGVSKLVLDGVGGSHPTVGADKDHFTQHTSHLLGCGAAAVLVVVAIVFQVPMLGLFAALLCGAMMVGMVWMMLTMASKNRR
jgi:hypothetical protein